MIKKILLDNGILKVLYSKNGEDILLNLKPKTIKELYEYLKRKGVMGISLLVVGSRGIKDKAYVFSELDKVNMKISLIITGGASGVDSIAIEYAKFRNIPFITLWPNWSRFKGGAGKIRNSDMVLICDFGIAFWDKKSTETEDSIEKLRKANKLLKVCICNEDLKDEDK